MDGVGLLTASHDPIRPATARLAGRAPVGRVATSQLFSVAATSLKPLAMPSKGDLCSGGVRPPFPVNPLPFRRLHSLPPHSFLCPDDIDPGAGHCSPRAVRKNIWCKYNSKYAEDEHKKNSTSFSILLFGCVRLTITKLSLPYFSFARYLSMILMIFS